MAASFPHTDTPPRFPRRASAAAEPALAVAATDGTSASWPVAPLRDDILSRSLRNRSGRALLPKKLCYTSNILPQNKIAGSPDFIRPPDKRLPRRSIKTVFSARGMAPGSDRRVKAACRTSRTAPRASLRKEFCQFSRNGFRPYRA